MKSLGGIPARSTVKIGADLIDMFVGIMVILDGSEASRKAAKAGVSLAKTFGGKVFAVYIADAVRLAYMSGCGEFLDTIREELLQEGERATINIEKMAKDAGVSCEKVVLVENPRDELLKISKDNELELLVIGDSGQSRLNKFLYGHSIDRIISYLELPVLMV